MEETGNNNDNIQQTRLTIRIAGHTLSFAAVDREAEHQLAYEPYDVKIGMSIAANLRQAFGESELLGRGYKKARVFIDTPILAVPMEEFKKEDMVTLYQHAFTSHSSSDILYRVQPTLNMVAVFSINKDLKMVIEDHFEDVRFTPILQPVWSHLQQRSFSGMRRKLYSYFHEKRMEVFCFEKNRIKYFNSFPVEHAKDALYFILYVWKQLGFNQQQDELHLAGTVPNREWLLHNAKLYIRRTLILNPSAEFNRAPITEIKDIPFDLLTLCLGKSAIKL